VDEETMSGSRDAPATFPLSLQRLTAFSTSFAAGGYNPFFLQATCGVQS
jgi:hypothetical protein